MLSILIPTYNYVCVKLVSDLQQQAEGLGCPYEILVADDASDSLLGLIGFVVLGFFRTFTDQ